MRLSLFVVVATAASQTLAAPVIDGVRDALYGPPRAAQLVETSFGDNQSELDAAYGVISGNFLHLLITGNLQNNFNKLDVFIDSLAGGQNVILPDASHGGPNPTNDGWASGTNSPPEHLGMAGMTFDAGFAADYLLIFRHGLSKFDFDYAVLGGGANAYSFYENVFGGVEEGANPAVAGTPTAGIDFGHAFGIGFNNSNTGGVAGGSGAADQLAAAAVTTGLELAIPLAALGNPPGAIKVLAFINGDRHTYASNQFLAGLQPERSNLGGDGFGNFTGSLAGIDLNQYGGSQFFTVAPEPSAAMLATMGFLSLVCGGRFRAAWAGGSPKSIG